jgi:hypothetical protein
VSLCHLLELPACLEELEHSEIPATVIEIFDCADPDRPERLTVFCNSDPSLLADAIEFFHNMLAFTDHMCSDQVSEAVGAACRNFPVYNPEAQFHAVILFINAFGCADSAALHAQRVAELMMEGLGIPECEDHRNQVWVIANLARKAALLLEPNVIELIIQCVGLVFDQGLSDCIMEALCALFYVLKHDESLLDAVPMQRVIVETLENFDAPEVRFYLVMLLQICFLSMADDPLAEVHSILDYARIFQWMSITPELAFPIVKLADYMIVRGSFFLDCLIACDCFPLLASLLDLAMFDLKHFVFLVFADAIVYGNPEQVGWLIANEFPTLFKQGLTSQDPVQLKRILMALIVVAEFSSEAFLALDLSEELDALEDSNPKICDLLERLHQTVEDDIVEL